MISSLHLPRGEDNYDFEFKVHKILKPSGTFVNADEMCVEVELDKCLVTLTARTPASMPPHSGSITFAADAFVNSQMYISVSVLALLIVAIIAFGLGYLIARYLGKAKA